MEKLVRNQQIQEQVTCYKYFAVRSAAKVFFFKLLLCFLTHSILRHCTVVTTNNTNRQNLAKMVDTQPTKCG